MTNAATRSAMKKHGEDAFVLFPLGDKRFALPAEMVTELARPDQVQSFPHTTRMLAGVLVRRGNIVPVFDIAQVLIGPSAPARRYYLIALRKHQEGSEWTAIPVSGECVMAVAQMRPLAGDLPPYVRGLLAEGEEIIEILDLEKLAQWEVPQ